MDSGIKSGEHHMKSKASNQDLLGDENQDRDCTGPKAD
jgi:hypothetical protein